MSEINDAARSPWKDDEKLLDVNETTLASRITFLQEQLVKASQALRSEIDPTLSDQNLTEDNTFKQWVVCNSVYDASIKDIQNEGFNRMLYFLFDKCKGNIARLVNNYDIDIKLNSAGQLEDIKLVIMETETYEGDDE